MKISKYLLLALGITFIIFFIPFSWLKPGEMDLGGDNSRLYFYNPIAYLVSQSLYSISHSGLGGENLSYFAIPFFLLLAGVKSLVQSPTVLISISHGMNLSLGFFFCYLVVKELLIKEDAEKNTFIIEAASIVAGLYYTFSPNPIHWWGYPILAMNLVFLNPLLFYLLLRFFLSNKIRYLLVAVLVSFMFSSNFSFIGAPTFFSFFPLAGIFLLCYAKLVKRIAIPIKKLFIGLILFVLIQSFHLLPQIVSIMTPGTAVNNFIFGEQGKLQWGLKYFMATAPSIKVSNALLGLLQYTQPEFYWWIFAIFPLLFVLGFLWNMSRLYLLSAIFFLITLFFVSANITHLGLRLYALAFRIPGFAMFRVYYGQWQWVYLFFYTILVGLALATVMEKVKRKPQYMLISFLALLLLTTSWSFIRGKLTNTTLWQSNGISSHVKMDPQYEEVLSYIKSLPIDGKILSLPLNDPGYQVVKGENDAAYEGPSTITYIAGRNEFNGVAEFGMFDPVLLDAARNGNIAQFRDILSILNIKYIFYNEDPYIYGDNFPGLPYENVRKYFPDTQEGYREFIKRLGVKEVKSFARKYHIYEFDDSSYVPHIYSANTVAYWNDVIAVDPHTPLSFYPGDKRVALFDYSSIFQQQRELFDTAYFVARNTSTIFDFFKNRDNDQSKFVSPTISQKLSSPIYPLVILKEKRDLSRYQDINDAFIDRNLYFAEKRINELNVIKDIPVKGNAVSVSELVKQWNEPKLWEINRFAEYNSWEITLARYEQAMEKLIKKIQNSSDSGTSYVTSKVYIKNYLREHKAKLRAGIRENPLLSDVNKKYLSGLIETMFIDIYNTLNLELPDLSNIPFTVDLPLESGTYEVFINKKDVNNLDFTLDIDGTKSSSPISTDGEWLKFNDISVNNKQSLPIAFSINAVPNLVAQTNWAPIEFIQKGSNTLSPDVDLVTLKTQQSILSDAIGLLRGIQGWEGNTIYAVSFDYLTYDQYFLMKLRESGGKKTNQHVNDVYEETLRSKEWRKFSIAVRSAKDADAAFIQITKAIDDSVASIKGKEKKIEVKNLSVQKIYNPQIILKASGYKATPTSPQITFTQINPTKYDVTVRGANGPYALVLSQSFNQRWKLFAPGISHQAKTVKGFFTRFTGDCLESVTKIFLPGKGIDFWNRDTFETWGMDPIAEKTHLPVNGYANAWYIEPKDVGNQKDYTLIIEMTSQKLFYGSLLISLGALCAVILMLISSFFRKQK